MIAYRQVQLDKNTDIAKYNSVSQVGQATPSVYYTNLKTQYIVQTNINNDITVNIPITIGGYVQTYASAKQYSKADSQLQDLEAKTELEAWCLVLVNQVGQKVLGIKKEAVDSAKLSVEANQKSFNVSVRSATVFLNSIQVDDSALAIKKVQTFMSARK
jgi:hypothetical protein